MPLSTAKDVTIEHSLPRRTLRSLQYLLARLTSRDGYVEAPAAPFDLTFKGPAADCITRHIFRLGAHEPLLTRYLVEHIRLGPRDVALDIGANLGWYSVLLDRLSSPGARILAFEPDPESFRLLNVNLQLNSVSSVTSLNIALGEIPGSAELRRYNSNNNGCHTLFAGGNSEGGVVSVPVDTAARIWEAEHLGERPLKFMKIDVEGYEYFVLKGAAGLLKRCECVVLEYTPDALQLAGVGDSALLDCLRDAGLTAHCFEEHRLRPISFDELASQRTQRDLILTRSPETSALSAPPGAQSSL